MFGAIRKIAIMLLVLAPLSSCRPSHSPKPSFSISTLFSSPGTVHTDPCIPPAPDPGKASACGVLISLYMNLFRIPQTPFYFISAKNQDREPILLNPRSEAGDIFGLSDSDGRIVLDNLPPGAYYLVVWAPYNWALAVKSPDDPTLRVFIFNPDKKYNLGEIYVQWP